MSSQDCKEIILHFSDKVINVEHSGIQFPVPYNKGDMSLQSSVARALQRVLRTYKFGSSREKIFDNNDYLLLGQLLCQILIGSLVQGIIRSYLLDVVDKDNKKLKKRCRIYLEFENDKVEDMAILPWEYMWAELQDIDPSFLAADLEGKFDLIRRIKSNPLQFKPDPNKQVLILFVVTKLSKLETGPYDKLKEMLQEAFKDLIVIREIVNPTIKSFSTDLDKILKADRENANGFIIHYYGHAIISENEGQLSMMNETGDDHDWISDTHFADFFKTASRRPHIMVLQACSSGQIVKYKEKDEDNRGVALLLALRDIPAVVAMQNDVNVPDSFAFVENFYESLLQGDDVGEAVTKGRQFLGSTYLENNGEPTYSTNAFGAPILFISTKSPIQLFEKQKAMEEEKKSKDIAQDQEKQISKPSQSAVLEADQNASSQPGSMPGGIPQNKL